MQHTACGLHDRTVLALRNPVLLWGVRGTRFVTNAFAGKVLSKIATNKLTPTIGAESVDMVPGDAKQTGGKMTEKVRNFGFVLH